MDTSKAIGIIIANPEFEDVRSLEGLSATKKPSVPISLFLQRPEPLQKLLLTMLLPTKNARLRW